MGSRIYDYLSESFLFDEAMVSDQFQETSEDDLRRELRRYREFCLANIPELEREVVDNDSSLKLFTGVRRPPLSLLKQGAFYIQQYVLSDPLFDLTREEGEIQQSMSAFMGMRGSSIDRERVAKAARYLKALTPMVAANYVKLLPTSLPFEPPSNPPIRYSETGFADVLPAPLLTFIRDHAIVESIKKVDGGLIIDGDLEIGRGIHIRFKDHGGEDARGYQLVEQHFLSEDEEKGTFEACMTQPDTPPDPDYFNWWVFQSINQAAGHLYNRVLLENKIAAMLGACYLTRTSFEFRLLEQVTPLEPSIQADTFNSLLEMRLPFMDEVDIETLMKIRVEDGEAFQNFRIELEKHLRELRLVKDPEDLKIKTRNVVHELTAVQVNQVNQKIAQLKRRLLTEAVIAVGGLIGAVQSGGLSLIFAAIAAAKGYQTYGEYQSQKKQNPAFFLWKVLDESRRRQPQR